MTSVRAGGWLCLAACAAGWAGGCGQPAVPAAARRETVIVTVEDEFTGDEPAGHWTFRTPALWRVTQEGPRRFLQLLDLPGRTMMPGVRRPQEYAVFNAYEWRNCWISFWVRVDRDPAVAARDACVILGRQDNTRFYYVHLSGASDGVHTAVMCVEGDRRRSLAPEGWRPRPPLTDLAWHKVDVLRDFDAGKIVVKVDAADENSPALFDVIDRTYEWGHVGLGSFDDHASFGRVLIRGEARRPLQPPVVDPPATMPAD